MEHRTSSLHLVLRRILEQQALNADACRKKLTDNVLNLVLN